MASLETAWHLERREQQRTALDTLPVADISKRPESVATALQQSQKANEVAGKIVGTERRGQIQQDNLHTKHPDTLSKEPEIAQIQQTLYSGFGIDKNTDANNAIKKFWKGVIDGLLVGNGEVIMMIKNEWIDKFLNILKEQLGSLEWWKKIAEALGTSVWELFTGDAYERWKSVAELGLITTGAGAAGSLAKYAGKTAIRTSVKVGSEAVVHSAVNRTLYAAGRTAEVVGTWLQLPAKWVKKVAEGTAKAVGVVSEKTGVSATLRAGARVGNEAYERSGAKKVVDWTRQAIKSTIDTGVATIGATEAVQAVKWKIGEVIDKRMQAKYEKLEAEWKLIPKEQLDIDMYSPTQLKWLQERLWLPANATKEEIEKVFRLRLYEAMEQYEKQWKKNLERIGTDIMEQMRRNGIKDPKKVITDEIIRLKQVQANGDLLIISWFQADIVKMIEEKWLKSGYQVWEKPFWWRKQYTELRASVDKWLWIHWLDPKYATIVIERSDFQHLRNNYNHTHYIEHSMIELQWRAGWTYYDSILTGRLKEIWHNQQVINLNDIVSAQALMNMEKKYNLWWRFEEMKAVAIKENGFMEINSKWEIPPNTKMIKNIQPFVEVQIFWKVWQDKVISPMPTKK